MKRTINAKIVWLFLLLIVILFASTTFGTFEPFANNNTPTIPQFAVTQ